MCKQYKRAQGWLMRVMITKQCHSCISCAALRHGRSLCCPDPVYPSEIHALQEEHRRLMEALKLTVNHIARLERLLGFLSPEEQLIIDRMLINPYKNCTLDLMETLHLEKSQIYNLRAGAMKKLLRLRYGACASADAIQASNRAERGS